MNNDFSALKGKHIILGITGGIAAYKSVFLLRLLIKAGAEVQVVITPNGREFITPVTLSALSGKPVICEFFAANTGEWHSHVDLGLWADCMIIAPATASTISKMANGVADNMLVTTYLSAKSQVFVAPAMDLDMMAHPSTTRNLELLRSYGNIIIEPGVGELASHLSGKGRMEEPENIVNVINNYFEKACTLQNDIACEIIIELGDMDFWQDKDDEYRFKMIDVYNEQIQDLNKIVPNFKVANATIHFDETSPHMHVIGVPVIDNCKKGMKKQVGKSKVFTKESLTAIQDKMRNACIKSYNKFYGVDSRLKAKQKGRNQDINVKEMDNYREIKKRLEQQKQKLENANKRTKKLDNSSKGIIELLDNLKPMPFNKNNSQISNENIENIKN